MRISLTTIFVGAISLIGVAIVYSALARAEAQVTCTTIGNQTFCNGPQGSVTCTRIGNQTFCN